MLSPTLSKVILFFNLHNKSYGTMVLLYLPIYTGQIFG